MIEEIFDPKNYFFNPYAVPVLITGFFAIAMGVFVFRKNPSNRKNRNFFFLMLFIFLWLFFASINYFSNNPDVALFWYKYFAYNAALLISSLLYFFNISWSDVLYKKQKKTAWLFLLFFSFMAILNLHPSLMVVGTKLHFYGYYVVFDTLGVIGFIVWCVPLVTALLNLFYVLKTEKSESFRKQTKLMIAGYLIGYTGAVDFFPAIFKNIEIYASGYISIFVLIVFLSYAFIRYKLMDIETVLHKTAAWIILSASMGAGIFVVLLVSYEWIKRFGVFGETLFLLGVVYFFYLCRKTIQPTIDRFFRRKKYEYQETLVKITEEAARSIYTDELIEKVCKCVYNVLYPRRLCVLLNTERGFVLTGCIEHGEYKKTAERPVVLSLEDPLVEWVKKHKRVIQRDQLDKDPSYQKIKKSAKWFIENDAEMLVPLLLKDNVVGFLVLGKKESLKKYTFDDLRLLENLGRNIGSVLNNTLLHEKIIERERGLRKKIESEVQKRTKELQESKLALLNMMEDVDEANKKLLEAQEKLQRSYEELKRVDEKKDEFISIAAHELKTPITAIHGFSQLLQNDKIIENKEMRKKFLKIIDKETKRLGNLVTDILDLSRIDLGTIKFNYQKVDLYEVLESIKREANVLIREGLEINYEIEKGLPKIITDRERLVQILLNLINNAVKYTPKGKITVGVKKEGAFIHFYVKDTGIGIAKAQREKIFERFYQIDSSYTRKKGGTGLGLSLCKEFVERLGGRIWVESKLRKGSTFHFTLPVNKNENLNKTK